MKSFSKKKKNVWEGSLEFFFSVLCVKKGANLVAHSLAKFARQIDGEIVWLEENPPLATKALYFDNCNIMNE